MSSEPDAYEAKPSAWKAKNGIPLEAQELPDDEQLMIAEDAIYPGKDYCWRCGDKFFIRDMRVDTDPYIQDDDRPDRTDNYIPKKYRVRCCKPCFKKEEDGDE